MGLEWEARDESVHIRSRKSTSGRHTLRVYNVAELVVPIELNMAASGKASATAATADNSRSATEENPPLADTAIKARPETKLSSNLEFAPLIELIRTTIEPNSWGEPGGRIDVNVNDLSLVIRQTGEVHEQIVDLLSQLRAMQDEQLTTAFVVLNFRSSDELHWLDANLRFHESTSGPPWILLPLPETKPETRTATDRFMHEELTAAKQHGQVLSLSRISTFAGQEACQQVSTRPDWQLNLHLTAVPLPKSELIKVNYSVAM